MAPDAWKIKNRGMQGNGIGQIIFRHELIDQRLTRGLIDGVYHTEKTREGKYMPVADDSEKHH